VAMTEHRNLAIVTIILFLTLAAWSIFWLRKNKPLGTVFIISMVLAGAVLASTAWHGGELVYRYGIGVMSLPKVESEGHNHLHADGHDHGGDAITDTEVNHHDHRENSQHDEPGIDFGDMEGMLDNHHADGHDH